MNSTVAYANIYTHAHIPVNNMNRQEHRRKRTREDGAVPHHRHRGESAAAGAEGALGRRLH